MLEDSDSENNNPAVGIDDNDANDDSELFEIDGEGDKFVSL